MTGLAAKIIGGLVAAILIVIAALYVLQVGPFRPRPSAAAKQLPKVQAQVDKTQGQQGAAVAKAETNTKAAAAAADKKAENHVAQIRKATARAVPAAVPDGEFYRGVCDTIIYARDPGCRGVSGQP